MIIIIAEVAPLTVPDNAPHRAYGARGEGFLRGRKKRLFDRRFFLPLNILPSGRSRSGEERCGLKYVDYLRSCLIHCNKNYFKF